MADEKKTRLSIVIRAVDAATAKIKAINDRLDAATKPTRDFKKALGELREKSGLDDVIGGFKGVGSAITDLLGKLLLVGGVVGAAVAGLLHLVDGFDELGDKAEAIGVSVDFLAQMRYAAERSGASIESLDGGLQAFSKSLGQARAGTGRMTSFLKKVSPALLTQLKGAKSNEEAFNLLAGAMAKLEDPAKRAALAQAALGDASLGPLFSKGPKGIKELRDRYAELAGSQEGAAAEAGKVDDSMKDLKASTDGIKAALVEGLSPALKVIVDQLREWFTEHRGDVKEWAAELGQRLPAAFNTLVGFIRGAVGTLASFFDSGTKIKIALAALAAVIVGPVIGAVGALGIALLTSPIGPWVAGLGLAAALVIKYWGPIKEFFGALWDGITGVFEAAWDKIKYIVDKVIDAAKFIKDQLTGFGPLADDIDKVRAQAGAGLRSDIGAQALAATQDTRTFNSAAKITVDFANAPRGMRAKADPQSSADVDFSVGYQMLGVGP